MNTIISVSSLLLLSSFMHGMNHVQHAIGIDLSLDTFDTMIWQEPSILEPYLDGEPNGYVQLLATVNAQLIEKGAHIDLRKNEFFKEAWLDKGIQNAFNLGVNKPETLVNIFRRTWRNTIRKKLSEKTPIKYIENQGEATPLLTKRRLQANSTIDPHDPNNQKQLRAAKEAIYAGLEIEKLAGKKQ